MKRSSIEIKRHTKCCQSIFEFEPNQSVFFLVLILNSIMADNESEIVVEDSENTVSDDTENNIEDSASVLSQNSRLPNQSFVNLPSAAYEFVGYEFITGFRSDSVILYAINENQMYSINTQCKFEYDVPFPPLGPARAIENKNKNK